MGGVLCRGVLSSILINILDIRCSGPLVTETILVVYYESLKRAPKTKTMNGYRYDERLKTNVEESTRLG
jgi:hypothetical protein